MKHISWSIAESLQKNTLKTEVECAICVPSETAKTYKLFNWFSKHYRGNNLKILH